MDVYGVDDNSWGEYTVTWNNRPAMGVLPFASLSPGYGWDESDVTSYFNGDGIRSIGLVRGPVDSNRRTQSRESLYSPELIIEYIAPAPQNHAPYFQSASFASSDGVEGMAYNGDISSEAADPDGDVLIFSKAAGPAWLIVNPDGTLEGVPGTDDVGVNIFTMRVEDGSGLYDEGSLNISVYGSADINGDGDFNIEDFGLIAKNWQNA
ncbi:MAG: hypothetical protein KAR47_17140, partial [Planctomycetes bacterium]|nr:hypothetical protein [Planctomycetota bacterium]